MRRARDTGWVVRSNPYEGGSDHTSFTKAGVPALLNWHFTDRYYHTNLDRPDKTSAAEMVNVGVSVAATLLTGDAAGWSLRKGAVWWLSNRTRDGDAGVVLKLAIGPDLV